MVVPRVGGQCLRSEPANPVHGRGEPEILTEPVSSSRRTAGVALLIVAIWATFAWLTRTGPGQRLEGLGFDALTVLSSPEQVTAPIVIVGIDEPSFAELDRQWPWPRDLHAELIDRLKAAGAAVIAFDVVFAEPADAAADRRLAEAIARAGNVVLAADLATQAAGQYEMSMRVEPIRALREAGAWSGLTSIDLDRDLVVRAIPAYDDAFWRQVVRKFRAAGDQAMPVGPAPGSRLRYLGPDHAFRYVSYYQALDPAGRLPADVFAGRIVLIGHDIKVSLGPEAGRGDAFATPYSATTGMLTPGVEIQATSIANALAGRAIVEVGWPWRVALIGLALLLSGLPIRDWQPWRGVLAAIGVSAACLGGAAWLFIARDTWLPVLLPIVAVAVLYVALVAMAFFRERRQRRRLRAMFARYVSPNLVNYLVAHPEALRLSGARRECSFVFTDLAGFTGLMEGIAPETAVTLLNDYLDGMIEIAFRHDGTLDRIVGDAVAVLFSAPIEQPDHRQRALACAIDMLRFSERFAVDARARGIAFGTTRIGVHSGEVTVGNFGGKTLFDYRALGDPVNTAARLESVNKQLGTRICVSEATLSGCPAAVTRPVGRLLLKGKSRAVMVHEPLLAPDGGPAEPDVDYARAHAWLAKDAAEALVAFRRLAAERPGDGLVAFQLRRLESGQIGDEFVFGEK